MMVRRGIGMRGLGYGLGQTMPNPANYSAWGDFLNAAMLANGIQPGSCNSPLTCNSITEFQAIYQAAVQAWQGLNSPTGAIVQQQAQQNAAAQAAAVQANAAPPVNVVSVAAPTQASLPAQVVSVAAPASATPTAVVSSASSAAAPSSSGTATTSTPSSACTFALFGETSCIGPIGSTTLLVLGGAALLLFSMSGKR